MDSRDTSTRRGGSRPGAGAPRGNLNALRTGRHSRRFPDAACYVRILPHLRHELDLAHRKSPALAARRLTELLHAARHVLATDSDLIDRLETAIFRHRHRLAAIPNGALALQLIVTPRRRPTPATS